MRKVSFPPDYKNTGLFLVAFVHTTACLTGLERYSAVQKPSALSLSNRQKSWQYKTSVHQGTGTRRHISVPIKTVPSLVAWNSFKY